MTTIPVILILSCLFILGSSRPHIAVRVVAIQGICLGLLPFIGSIGNFSIDIIILGAGGLVFKVLLPLLMQTALRHTGIQKESIPYVAYGTSILIGVLLLALSSWLAVNLGFPAGTSLLMTATSIYLMLIGLFLMISKRSAIMQSLAYLVLENGVYALGVSISLEFPLIVELGILLDIFVAVFLMGNLIFHLDRETENPPFKNSNKLPHNSHEAGNEQ